MTIGIYFATTTGKTEDIAERLHGLLSNCNSPKDLADLSDLNEFNNLDAIICGIPTWNTGADYERSGTAWDAMLEEIGGLNLHGKRVAIFGLGDSSTYTENFCDAMEELHSFFKKAGATMVGYVRTSDYTFDDSKSAIGELFCGLPLDEDGESDLTDDRLIRWAEALKKEIPGLT
ncbi:flavodoxin FldA [Prochlorococcus sp. MIT 1341]|uniref:flavodoxin FldA n=1 Tax=Prochlorococcus sp. MIT 1341 TaxID=3096221 RepID=UPI002A749338|nr:flavodoxin FldA [Prochlorococcus sp. MIT 1341]